MGSDYGCFYLPLGYLVSIHAPTRGATNELRTALCLIVVSTHAPTWGATRIRITRPRMRMRFNPRSHMGSDSEVCPFIHSFQLFQSTLPHGERPMRTRTTHHRTRFNPRSHMGSDRPCGLSRQQQRVSIHAPTRGATICSIHLTSHILFQSTLPHGERR